ASFISLLASNAFADTTQTFEECRQSEGKLEWYLVTYTVPSNGQREPTEAEDLNQACTAADYERSRQAAARFGDVRPPLPQQAAVAAPARPVIRPGIVQPARPGIVQPARPGIVQPAPVYVDQRVVDVTPDAVDTPLGEEFVEGPRFGPGVVI